MDGRPFFDSLQLPLLGSFLHGKKGEGGEFLFKNV